MADDKAQAPSTETIQKVVEMTALEPSTVKELLEKDWTYQETEGQPRIWIGPEAKRKVLTWQTEN